MFLYFCESILSFWLKFPNAIGVNINNLYFGSGQMAQQLIGLDTLPGDLNLIPSLHVAANNHL